MNALLRLTLALAAAALLVACGGGEPTATQSPARPLATATARPSPTATPIAVPPAETAAGIRSTAIAILEPSATPQPVEPSPAAASAPAAFDPASISLGLEPVAGGLNSPVFATHAGDGSGRVFVLEQGGTIAVIGADGGEPQPFLDIRDRVGSSGSEQGLLGLAFHPDFAANGRFFVYYTDKKGDTAISRFAANAERTRGDPASEVVLVTAGQPAANHNGGMLAFGPDGMLYAGLGDGGAANDRFGNGQNLRTILGTLIRLDVDGGEPYAVPADNPFVGIMDANDLIWAWGLRNPWRFSFDRATGDLFIADVGQNLWEEVDVQPAGSAGGENYGWPIMEATHCFQNEGCDSAGLVLPIAEYGHGPGCSVTGGYVYRGQAFPDLQGVYLYGDYCSGVIWGLGRDADAAWLNAELLRSGLQISSFGETEAGEVLVVNRAGSIYRVVDGTPE